MIIEPAPDLKSAMIQALRQEYMLDQQRPGTHLSSLIYCLTKAFFDRFDPEPPSEVEVGLWSIGFALERVMINKLHVEPIVLDGITMTPDFTLDGTLADLKSTRMAPTQSDGCAVCGTAYRGHSRDELGHSYEPTSRPFDMPIGWQRQFMGYRHGLNVTSGTVAHDFGVVAMHLIPAELTTWRVWFTAGELEANWQWVLTRKAMLESMYETNQPQPFQHLGYEDECRTCRYKLRCQLYVSIEKLRESRDSTGAV